MRRRSDEVEDDMMFGASAAPSLRSRMNFANFIMFQVFSVH